MEVVPIHGQEDEPSEFWRGFDQVRHEQSPVIPSPGSLYAEEPDRPEEGFYLVALYFTWVSPRWFIHSEKGPNPLVIFLGRVYRIQNMLVTAD